MNLFAVVSIAFALAMDSFAVSITNGVLLDEGKRLHALRIGLFFGGFQGLMPIIGWLAGTTLRSYLYELGMFWRLFCCFMWVVR